MKEIEEKDVRLSAIVDFDMNEEEAKAYKLCLMWLDISKKIFPDYHHDSMRKGDPRKSMVFKVCYKLARETKGLIEENDYPLYIRSQLDILRAINIGNNKPLISVNCLVGEKAWKRWKLWKKKYDLLSKKPAAEVQKITLPGVEKALSGIEKTQQFINSNFKKEPSFQDYQEAYNNGKLFAWINFGKISPYYMVLSPYLNKILKESDFQRLNFDTQLYKPLINDVVEKRFKELFGYEQTSNN